MKPHHSTNTRHTTPSRQANWPADARPPQTANQQQPALAECLNLPPTKHSEKAVSRRLHRKKAAVYIGTSLSWLDKSRLRGDGPAYLQVGGRVIYDVQDLDAFLASCRRQSTSEPR